MVRFILSILCSSQKITPYLVGQAKGNDVTLCCSWLQVTLIFMDNFKSKWHLVRPLYRFLKLESLENVKGKFVPLWKIKIGRRNYDWTRGVFFGLGESSWHLLGISTFCASYASAFVIFICYSIFNASLVQFTSKARSIF